MKKRILATMMVAIMMFAMSTTAFAAEATSWKNYDFSKYTSNWSGSGSTNASGWNWGGNSGWGSGSGWSWGGNNKPGTGGNEAVEQDNRLDAPSIGECRYIHQSLNAPDCLVVDWSDVEGAASYEM